MVTVSATASAAAVLAVASAVATAMTSASTTLVTHAGEQVLNLLGCGIAILKHGALELQGLTGQRMVGVEGHAVGFDAGDVGHEVLVVLAPEGDDGTRINVRAVELAVDLEELAAQFAHTLLIVFAKSLGGSQGEVESLVSCQLGNVGLEIVKREAEAGDKLERLALLGLLNQLLLAVGIDGEELITNADVLVLLVVHDLFTFILGAKIQKRNEILFKLTFFWFIFALNDENIPTYI